MNNDNKICRNSNTTSIQNPGRFKTFINKHKLPLILIAVAFMIALCFMPAPNGIHQRTRQEMTEYLKKTYDKEFEIKELEIRHHSPYGYYTYEASAYPKGHPELEFRVDGADINKGYKYGDTYLAALWSYQGEQDLEKTMQELYGDTFIIDNFSIGNRNPKYKDLHYTEVLKRFKDAIIKIEYLVFTDKEINKQEEAEKVFKILNQYVISYDIKRFEIIVYYFPTKYKKEFPKALYRQMKSKLHVMVKSFDVLYKEYGMVNYIKIFRASYKSIKNGVVESAYGPLEISDIVKSFKY